MTSSETEPPLPTRDYVYVHNCQTQTEFLSAPLLNFEVPAGFSLHGPRAYFTMSLKYGGSGLCSSLAVLRRRASGTAICSGIVGLKFFVCTKSHKAIAP